LADFRAHTVVDRSDGRAASAFLALRAELFARRRPARHFSLSSTAAELDVISAHISALFQWRFWVESGDWHGRWYKQ
jgi:hypothetical protein